MAGTAAVELSSALVVDPVLREGDIEAFLRLNRRYFILLDDPHTDSETRWIVLRQVALNFKSLDHWLSQGKPWPAAWREARVDPDPGEQAPESREKGSPQGCGKGTK